MKKKTLDNFKKPLFFLEDHLPFIGRPTIKLLRDIRFIFYKIIFSLRKNQTKDINIFKIYLVDPEKIQYCYNGRFNVFADRGMVKGGNWDISDKKFSESKTYQGLKERFIEHKEWKETRFYKDILKRINNGEIMWRCRSKEEWEKRLKLIDNLYESIKTKGYYLNIRQDNNQSDTYQGKADKHYGKIDEILISIGRNGQLLFNDGAHRLAIAKILQLSKIPVMVLVRHKKWMDFKDKLKSYAELKGGKLYQPAYYCDLEDIPFVYGPERFELIKNNTSFLKGRVLDIGANLGYFCHRFEQLGFDCWAVEINPEDAYFMQRLRDANNEKFKIIQQSIFDYKKGQVLNFDIVLALNIFHHFLKRKSTYEKLRNLLHKMKAKELFFETHNPEEYQMKGAYKNYNAEDFVKFIIENSFFKKYILLSALKGQRRLYKIF
ncbi:MAG: methyltransferase [Candidatus Nealsonbacteria bacterium]